jgi:hypothetical protein
MNTLKSILLTAIVGLTLSFAGFRPCSGAEIGKGVDFYLLEDENMSFQTARDLPLNELKLQAAPWIASDNIERYDWSSHYVYLKQSVDIPNMKGAKYVNLAGKPFVVVADGKRCYMGAMWSHLSSSLPPGSVAIVYVERDKLQRFKIGLHTVLQQGESVKDMRDNSELKETLKREGLFHAGMEGTLDGITVERDGKSLIIVYTYTLRNADQDDLYVLDPQKFHPAIFHDYRNGVTAQDLEHGEYNYISWPNPRVGEPPYALNKDLSWYTRLEKGKTMTRTVTMNLMPTTPPLPGKYKFAFRFNGEQPAFSPMGGDFGTDNNQLLLKNNEVASDPKTADGRVWLGQISAELTQVVK